MSYKYCVSAGTPLTYFWHVHVSPCVQAVWVPVLGGLGAVLLLAGCCACCTLQKQTSRNWSDSLRRQRSHNISLGRSELYYFPNLNHAYDIFLHVKISFFDNGIGVKLASTVNV